MLKGADLLQISFSEPSINNYLLSDQGLAAPANSWKRIRSLYSCTMLSPAADPTGADRGGRRPTAFCVARALHSNLCVGIGQGQLG